MPLIGVHSRGVLFILFVSEPALFLPGITPGLPSFLPLAAVTQLLKSHQRGHDANRTPYGQECGGC